MLKKISEIYKELEAIGAKPEIITAQGIDTDSLKALKTRKARAPKTSRLKKTFESDDRRAGVFLSEIQEREWQNFSEENSELVKDWFADVLKIHQTGRNWVCFGFIDEHGSWNNRWVKAFEIRKFLMNLVRNFMTAIFTFRRENFLTATTGMSKI